MRSFTNVFRLVHRKQPLQSIYYFRGLLPYQKEYQQGNYEDNLTKNVVLLVTKKICKSIFQVSKNYVQTNCSNVTPLLFKSIRITLRRDFRWRFPDTLFQYGISIQAVIVFQQFFFCSLPNQFVLFQEDLHKVISIASFLPP